MTPEALLTKLQELDVDISLDGDSLRLEAPVGVLTEELKEQVRQHKRALMALLEKQAEKETKEAVKLLRERGWVVIDSRVLGDRIVWCRNKNVVIPTKWKDAVTYTLGELKELTKLHDGKGLKQVHEAKRILKGRIVSVEGDSK